MRAWYLLVLTLSVACDDLPAAQEKACGNRFIDTATEDCDTFAPPGALCILSGPNQCRYACGLQKDTPNTYACPAGMGCGADGTCRASKGTFAAAGSPVAGTFADIAIGDVDGDHLADVVGLEPLDFSTTYFDATLSSATTVHLARNAVTTIHPMLRDISGDHLADLIAGFGNGTLVNLGSASRSFIPTGCPSTYIKGLSNAQIISLKALPPNPGDTIFVMGTDNGASGIALLESSGQGSVLTVLDKPPNDLAGLVVAGHFIENLTVSPCDEIAFGRKGDDHLDVYTTCIPNGSGYVYNTFATPSSVSLTGGATLVRGPMLLDVNGDGHLDFLVGAARCSGCNEVDVAYGVGDGTFNSGPTVPTSGGDEMFSTYPLVSGPLPLAMGDLNGDGIPDQVGPTSILVSHLVGSVVTFTTAAVNQGSPWTEAVIADFNHDGIPDVAAGSSESPNLSFFNGAGDGSFSPFILPSGAVEHFTVGDFDGDHVNDLALMERATASDVLGDSMSILFGNAVGAPDAPVSMGRFPHMKQITQGHFIDINGVLSSTANLLTVSEPDNTATVFGSFAGEGNRVLRSPAGLNVPTSTTAIASTLPHRYALGHFSNAAGPYDVAIIDNQFFPPRVAPAYRSWILPTDGHGGFDDANAHVVFAPLSDAVDWGHANVAAIDVDGSGVDQLVALGPSTDPSKGAAAIARYAPGVGLVFDQPTTVDAVVSHEETNAAGAQTGRLLVDDLDGDGNPDLLAVAAVGGVTSVVVFWNDHAGQLGSMTTLANPNGHAAVDVAVLDAGAAGPDVAILTDEGVSLVGFAGRAPSPPTFAFSAPGAHLMATGDVNGDGVTDIVVANDTGFSVYQGQAVRP